MQLNRKVRPEILDSVALLVIDAQDGFIDSISDKAGFKKRAAFAIEAARCLKLHTLFTEQAPEKIGRTNSDLFKLARNPRVFPKQTFSALGAAGIEAFLRDKEIYNLLIVGLETPICIYQTGLQATDEDIDITFLSDCLGSRRPQDDAPVLDALRAMDCQVLPSETVFYSLLSDTQNPYFGAFTKIVKAFGAEDFNLETYLQNRPAEVDETPERPQKPQRKERPERAGREDSDESENRRERRPQRRDDRKDDRPDERRDNKRDDESEERHNRKRRRGRGRGRGRDSESTGDKQNENRPERSERSERSERPRNRPERKPKADSQTESKPEPKPAPQKESPAPKPVAETPAAPAPAKKAAKKAAKKVAKKATKKVAKKAAKKAARKVAKKPEAE